MMDEDGNVDHRRMYRNHAGKVPRTLASHHASALWRHNPDAPHHPLPVFAHRDQDASCNRPKPGLTWYDTLWYNLYRLENTNHKSLSCYRLPSRCENRLAGRQRSKIRADTIRRHPGPELVHTARL